VIHVSAHLEVVTTMRYTNRRILYFMTKGPKKQRKKSDSGKLGIRPDHPCRRIEIKFFTGVVFAGSSKFQVSSKSVK